MKNRIDFQITDINYLDYPTRDEYGVLCGTRDVELIIKQSFPIKEFKKVERIIDLSNPKVHVIFDRKIEELDKYTDEEILEYLRTRNNDNR